MPCVMCERRPGPLARLRAAMVAAVVAAGLLAGAAPAAAGAAPTAEGIVAASDAVRNPAEPFRVINTLIEYRQGQPQNRMALVVYSKTDPGTGQFRTLVRFAEPPRDQDKLILKDGNIMWFYDPAAKASVRLSPQQRLMGQASNGDVVTVNLAKDYAATLDGEETILDADHVSRACYRLNLRAVADSVTYWRIDYWVERDSFFPVKGKFYADSGRLLKTAYYRGRQAQMGRLRPTETLIIDGVDAGLVTKMVFADFQPRNIPESWFNRDYLPRFRGE